MNLCISILQITIFFFLSFLGTEISKLTNLPIPGALIGVLLLFLLLQKKIIPLKYLEQGGNWLLAELLLFFIPSAVGLIKYQDLLIKNAFPIILIILLSTTLVMLSTGLSVQVISHFRKK